MKNRGEDKQLKPIKQEFYKFYVEIILQYI